MSKNLGSPSSSGLSSSYGKSTPKMSAGQELTASLLAKYDRPTGTTDSASAATITQRMHEARDISGGEYGTSASVIQQLKTNLINNSAELLIAKGRIDELTRERERVVSQVNELQAALSSAQREARGLNQASDEAHRLRSELSKTQLEARTNGDRAQAAQDELERERNASATLRGQVTALQQELADARATLTSKAREWEKATGSYLQQINEARGQTAAVSREKDELAARLEAAVRQNEQLEGMLEGARREIEDVRARAKEYARESDTAQAQVTNTMSTLSKTRSDMQQQLAGQNSTIQTLNSKLEALTHAKNRAEADLARVQTSFESAVSEKERYSSRWKAAEERAADNEAQILALKGQVNDLSTQLQIAQTRASAAASAASASAALKAAGSPKQDDEGGVAFMRRQVRELEGEREAIADILASIIPLPSFIRERAAESEGALYTSSLQRKANSSSNANNTSGDDSASVAGGDDSASVSAAAARASASMRFAALGSRRVSIATEDPNSVASQLRALAVERPMIIDALTYMDLQLRALKTDKDRLQTSLEASKLAEQGADTTLTTLRRQLNAARQEIAQASDAKDALADKLARTEADVRARQGDIASLRESLAVESAKREGSQKALDETRQALALARDEVEALRSRIDALKSDYEQQLSMERSMKEQIQQLHQAQMSESGAAHQQQMQAALSRQGALEGELDALRHENNNLQYRVSQTSAELDKARSDASQLSSKLVATEMALRQSEQAYSEAVQVARDTDASRQRTVMILEEVTLERDNTLNRLAALSGELEVVRSRMTELEALEVKHRDDEARIGHLQSALADTQTALAQAQAETEAADARFEQLREQARIDLEIAHKGTTRVADELQRMMRAREDDADASASLAAASSRSIAQLQGELENQTAEAGSLRERCRRLQSEVTQLAAEVQEQRDQARSWHDEAMRARSDLQSEVDRSSSLNRALMDQLEAIKADFYAFLSLFHPAEAAAAIVASTAAGNSGNARFNEGSASRQAATGGASSSPAGNHLVTNIATEMTDLKKRLEALTASQRGNMASSLGGIGTTGGGISSGVGATSYRSPSAGTAYMSRALMGGSSAAVPASRTLVGLGSTGSFAGQNATPSKGAAADNDSASASGGEQDGGDAAATASTPAPSGSYGLGSAASRRSSTRVSPLGSYSVRYQK